MLYKNGKDILPADLLKTIQVYVQGELIYIPKPEEQRAGWGEINGSRSNLERRNLEIFDSYKNGLTIDELMFRYNLSEDSIRKIITRSGQVAGVS